MNNEPNKPIPAQELTEKELEGVVGGALAGLSLMGEEVVQMGETPMGVPMDLGVPVDGDRNVTVPTEGASGYWQIGL